MRKDYDFRNAVRGKFFKRTGAGMNPILWGRLDPKKTIVEIVGAKDVKKDVPLSACFEEYVKAPGLENIALTKMFVSKVSKILDVKRKISTITVKDAQKVFDSLMNSSSAGYAYSSRALLVNSINYLLKGVMPEKRYHSPPSSTSDQAPSGDDVGKLKFSKAKVADIMQYVPLYTTTGRFWMGEGGSSKTNLLSRRR
jgi:hypothetical protein